MAAVLSGESAACSGAAGEPETAMQRRWARAELPAWFSSETGERLRLLYPGTWNHGPGPDFRAARLVAESGAALLGDVELHRRERDWVAHGHDSDPAYVEVVLHVVGRGGAPGPGASPRNRSGTEPSRVVVLPLSGSACAAVPRAARLPCHDVVRRGGRAAVEARLEQLAVERLRRKAALLRKAHGSRWSGRAVSPDDVAYHALMGALGQGDDRAAMERLALELPLAELQGLDREAISARLLGEAERLQRESLIRWQRRGRPSNRPAARIQAAAALLAGLLPELALGLAGLAELEPRQALAALRVPRLVGSARALQLLVDCCYPLALALPDLAVVPGLKRSVGPAQAERRLVRRWLDLPQATYQRTASLRARLTDQGHRSWRNAASQALLGLQADYCRLGGCAVCPLGRLAREPVARRARPSTNL